MRQQGVVRGRLTFALVLLSVTLLWAAPDGRAELVTQSVEYRQDGAAMVGYLAYDDALAGPRPGVLVVHEWWGLNDYARMRADQLAGMGYVAFAVDMYGGGVSTDDRQEAARLAGQVRGTPLMRHRGLAGLQVLAAQDLVDAGRLAAIGFCFGGTAVLELAYSGADLVGVVSFHGGLTQPQPEDLRNIKSKLLILHGAEDPSVSAEDIGDLQRTLSQAGIDWQMIYYARAVHAFTNPAAGDDASRGAAYDPRAAGRSWKHMQMFFEEIFGEAL